MSIIKAYYLNHAPSFTAEQQFPGAVRYEVSGVVVDAIDGEPTAQEVADFIDPPAEIAERARIEDTKNDTEGMAFLDLMKSKTSAQRKAWLSSNVADPNVRKVLQGLMSIVLWKVA